MLCGCMCKKKFTAIFHKLALSGGFVFVLVNYPKKCARCAKFFFDLRKNML